MNSTLFFIAYIVSIFAFTALVRYIHLDEQSAKKWWLAFIPLINTAYAVAWMLLLVKGYFYKKSPTSSELSFQPTSASGQKEFTIPINYRVCSVFMEVDGVKKPFFDYKLRKTGDIEILTLNKEIGDPSRLQVVVEQRRTYQQEGNVYTLPGINE